MREVQAHQIQLDNSRRFNLTPNEIRYISSERNRYYNYLSSGNKSLVDQGIYREPYMGER